MSSRVVKNISICSLDNRNMLREVMAKIGLERIDTQEGVTVNVRTGLDLSPKDNHQQQRQ